MLLRFSATNFLSLRDQCELSFVAAPLKELAGSTVPSRFAKHGVLPVAAIYGANASGKSNVLYALRFMRGMILSSFSEGEEGEELTTKPFLLDEDSRSRPTKFSIDFIFEDVRYQFGFSFNAERILEEWLFAFPNIVQQLLYSREYTDGEDRIKFGRSLGGSNRQIQTITRKNSLFISAAEKSNHPLLGSLVKYFRRQISFAETSNVASSMAIAERLHGNDNLIRRVIAQLQEADTGIVDLEIKEIKIPEEARANMEEILKIFSKFGAEPSTAPETNRNVRLGHIGEDGRVHHLDYGDESMGTRYLLMLLPPMLAALARGGTLVLDEITTGLHTLLAKKLVQTFMNHELNPKGAQLIFSTHDTNLLTPGVLRRDSVWFAEKSRGGSTAIYPLTDVKTKNTDNIERGYIQGRYGAVPFFPQPEEFPAEIE
jgi:AAA15 family ATPase/GTPase